MSRLLILGAGYVGAALGARALDAGDEERAIGLRGEQVHAVGGRGAQQAGDVVAVADVQRDHVGSPRGQAVQLRALGGVPVVGEDHLGHAAHPRLQVDDFAEAGAIIAAALAPDFETHRDDLAERVATLAERFPLYEHLDTPAAA